MLLSLASTAGVAGSRHSQVFLELRIESIAAETAAASNHHAAQSIPVHAVHRMLTLIVSRLSDLGRRSEAVRPSEAQHRLFARAWARARFGKPAESIMAPMSDRRTRPGHGGQSIYPFLPEAAIAVARTGFAPTATRIRRSVFS
jgi:hypothetical protein